MYNITPLEEKIYYLFNIEADVIEGSFYNWNHLLYWSAYMDLKHVGNNKNDTVATVHYYYRNTEYKLDKCSYIFLDSSLKVVSKDLLAKGIESYQRVYPNPYRVIKRGTNKKKAYNGYRHTTRFYKNTVAMLVGDKKEFPLNKRDVLKRNRLFEWDTSRRSNKGSSWKIKKNKKQWM